MKKTQLLENLGLSTIAATIYLHLIEAKRATVLDIARDTGVSRTNVYYNTNKLKDMGLIGEAIEGKKKYLIPEPPQKLIFMLQKKKDLAVDVASLLEEDYKKNKHESKIEFGYGPESFKKFAEQVIHTKEKPVRQMVNFSALTSYTSQKYMEAYWRRRVENNVPVRVLSRHVDRTLITKQSRNKTEIENIKMLREIRFLPADVKIELSIITFDNKVQFFAPAEEGYMFTFESPSFANTVKTIFDYLWTISEPY